MDLSSDWCPSDLVIAFDQFPRSGNHADVVLAAAGYADVDSTTTNREGRISTVSRKITPPGTARSDWMIAAELARLLGADLGVESAEQIWAEIEALAQIGRASCRESVCPYM